MLGVTPRERELEDRESDLNDEEIAELDRFQEARETKRRAEHDARELRRAARHPNR